jgi:hypothetical protein
LKKTSTKENKYIVNQKLDHVDDISFREHFGRISLYSYETDFIQGLLKKNEKKLARSFNFTLHYIYDVLSVNNSRFGDFVDCLYPGIEAINEITKPRIVY